MFAVYATQAAPDDPLSALRVGERPDPDVPEGWVHVKVSHASLNRHDLFTLRGMSGHPEGITYPIILGNDAAGTRDDGTPVVIDNVGADSWAHSMSSLARGGTLVTVGGTTGFEVALSLLPVFADQLTITGSIMGTLKDMEDMVRLIAQAKIEPEIGVVLPRERAQEAFRAMWEGKTHGKTVFTR